jgi:hypothetical protein
VDKSPSKEAFRPWNAKGILEGNQFAVGDSAVCSNGWTNTISVHRLESGLLYASLLLITTVLCYIPGSEFDITGSTGLTLPSSILELVSGYLFPDGNVVINLNSFTPLALAQGTMYQLCGFMAVS